MLGSTLETIDSALCAAHASGDSLAIMQLYHEAATQMEARGMVDSAAFFLTHAYVFALEAGHGLAGDLAAKLHQMGRL